MTPSIGRIVHYTLSEQDVREIGTLTGSKNHPQAGQVYPAMIVRVWDASVQLQVFYDGGGAYWATSRSEGDRPGAWTWPPRVTA